MQLQYPPGSTLKQFDALVALQNAVITPQTRVHDAGTLVVENRFAPGVTQNLPAMPGRGVWRHQRVRRAAAPSNIFFMSVVGGNKEQVVNLSEAQKNIPQGLNDQRFAQGMALFGLGAKTGVRLAGELPGRACRRRPGSRKLSLKPGPGDLYNAAIGPGRP